MKYFAIVMEQSLTSQTVGIISEEGDFFSFIQSKDLDNMQARMNRYGVKANKDIRFVKDWLQDGEAYGAILLYEQKTGLRFRPNQRVTEDSVPSDKGRRPSWYSSHIENR